MPECVRGHAAPARGALEEAALEQVGLVDVLDRVGLLLDGHGQRREPDRAAAELAADDAEDLAVQPVQALVVDLEQVQGAGGDPGVDDAAAAVGEESDTIEDVYEPYLLQRGFLQRTPRGRCATPRVANRLLKRVRDWAEVRGSGVVDEAAADAALTLLEVDDLGLDRLDREILSAVCAKFGGGPVGLSTLAIAVGEEADTIEDVYEPYLLQCGLLQRTPRGRAATARAYEHLGLEAPRAAAPLF